MTKQELEIEAYKAGLSYDEHVSLPKYQPLPPHLAADMGLPDNYQSVGRKVIGRLSGPGVEEPLQMTVEADGDVAQARSEFWQQAQAVLTPKQEQEQ